MLTIEDEPIIRRAINRRLGMERSVKLLEIKVADKLSHIAVGIEAELNDKIHVTSVFDLPPQFELTHVHNECDEIAEQYKEARLKMLFTGGTSLPDPGARSERHEAKGNGRRGNWKQYGERTN